MPLDGVAVDIQGFGCLDDISLINNEPMKEIMAFQTLGKESLLPETVEGGKPPDPFWFWDAGRYLEGQSGLSLCKFLRRE